MAAHESDRNLLLALLALQLNMVSPANLVASGMSWIRDRSTPLDTILMQQGLITAQQREALLQLIGESFGDETTFRDPTVTLEKAVEQRFEILSRFGSGGLGDVLLAKDLELHREVLLKQIKDKYADEPNRRRQFCLEAEITGGLEHPGIVPVYSFGRYANGRPYYAMRLVPGDDLKAKIQQFHRQYGRDRDPAESRVPLRRLLGHFIDVCHTIQYAHSRGVIHGDVKPSNILVGNFGETLVVDWGSARLFQPPGAESEDAGILCPPSADPSGHSSTASTPATPAFMSPEQAAGDLQQLGPATDVYSLGATLYMLLTGIPPFDLRNDSDVTQAKAHLAAELGRDLTPDEGWSIARNIVIEKVRKGQFDEPRTHKPDIPSVLEKICLTAMAQDAAERYASPQALAESIEQWLAEEPIAPWQEAVSNAEQLSRQYPTIPQYVQGLARNKAYLGLILSGMGRLPDAQKALSDSIALYEQLVGKLRGSVLYVAELIHTRQLLARVLTNRQRESDAQQQEQRAKAELEHLAELSSTNKEYASYLESVMLIAGHSPQDVADKLRPARIDDTAVSAPQPEDIQATVPYVPGSVRDQPRPRIQARFELLRQIAQTGLSQLWLAQDVALGREVALKQLVKRDTAAQQMFLREARITALLDHPSVPTVYGVGLRSEDDLPFYAMEHVEGETLLEAIKNYHAGQTPHTHREAELNRLLTAFAQVCRTVHFAHSRGILHGDAKPSNILLEQSGRVVLIDWGVSRVIESTLLPRGYRTLFTDSLDDAKAIFGTPAYMSPEQARGDLRELCSRSDVYVLGAALFQLLTGRLPYRGELTAHTLMDQLSSGTEASMQVRDIDASVPEKLNAMCAKAMARRKEQRYASASQLADEVERWLYDSGKSSSLSHWKRVFRIFHPAGR